MIHWNAKNPQEVPHIFYLVKWHFRDGHITEERMNLIALIATLIEWQERPGNFNQLVTSMEIEKLP